MCKVSLCLLLAVFGCLVADSLAGVVRGADVHRDIIVVKNVRDFVAQHPGLKMQRLVKQPAGRANEQSVRYTLGARISGKCDSWAVAAAVAAVVIAPQSMQRICADV